MENLYEIIGSILAAMVVGLLAYLAPRAGAWLSSNADNATEEAILRMVRSFARAAEQLLKAEDPDGEKRRQFVWEQLRLAGVEITEAVMNMIEGEVWAINTETKKALVQAKAQEGDGDVSSVVRMTADGVMATVNGGEEDAGG